MGIRIKLKENQTGYDAVGDAIRVLYPTTNESFIVELRHKYNYEDETKWHKCTELMLNEGYDYAHPDWVWEYDWWEGQQDIELLAVAPASEVTLSHDFRLGRDAECLYYNRQANNGENT